MSRSGSRQASRECDVQSVRLLTYHRIGVPREGRYEKLTVPPRRFGRQLTVMQLMGYRFCGLDAVAKWLRGDEPLRGRPVVLTFDDGYADLFEQAFPLLIRHRLPAVVYLVADKRTDSWLDWGRKGPLPLLSWEQAREMAEAGVSFGSHTLSHAHLTRCTRARAWAEIADSKKALEDELGRPVNHFCYPYGEYDPSIADAVAKAGYATACTTRKGVLTRDTDPYQLPRLTVGKRMGLHRLLLRLTVRN